MPKLDFLHFLRKILQVKLKALELKRIKTLFEKKKKKS